MKDAKFVELSFDWPLKASLNDFLNFQWFWVHILFFGSVTLLSTLPKIPQFHLISWYANFVETHSFCKVFCNSSETLRKLCVSIKFLLQEIRWNYGILCSVLPRRHTKSFQCQYDVVRCRVVSYQRLNDVVCLQRLKWQWVLSKYYQGSTVYTNQNC